MIPVHNAAARTPRAPQLATKTTTKDAAPPDPDTVAQEHHLAEQRQAFDFQMEENAEVLREHIALQELLMARLKAEDEIVKKWIELA